MSHTVIGAFNQQNQAIAAMNDLLENGFERKDIEILYNQSDVPAQLEGNAISRLFNKWLGSGTQANSTVKPAAGAILTVHAGQMKHARLAQEILDEAGAVNMDERVGTEVLGSDSFSPVRPELTEAEIMVIATPVGADGNRVNREGAFVQQLEVTPVLANEEPVSAVPTIGQAIVPNIVSNLVPNVPADNQEAVIPIIREEMHVDKKQINTGSTFLRSRIVEREVEHELNLKSEKILVERRAVDRPAEPSDLHAFREGSVEFTETREVPVITRQARVVEEVRLNRQSSETPQTIKGTVRQTEVDIERTDTPEIE